MHYYLCLLDPDSIILILRYTYNGHMSYLISIEVHTTKEVMILIFPTTMAISLMG